MTQQGKDRKDDKWIEKLIRFFRQMPGKKPDVDEADYTGWHQSEEQYRKEQEEWLKQVEERRKRKHRTDDGFRK